MVIVVLVIPLNLVISDVELSVTSEIDAIIKCSSCKREFANAACFQNHIIHSVCARFKMCLNCCTTYTVKKNSEHICGLKYCKICRDDMPIRHDCYIANTRRSAKPKNGALYIFYDFECYQTKFLIENDPTKKEHEVNLCVVQQACDKCRDKENNKIRCKFCGKRQHVF